MPKSVCQFFYLLIDYSAPNSNRTHHVYKFGHFALFIRFIGFNYTSEILSLLSQK